MEFKDLIYKRRKQLGLTMEDVAKVCGVSKATVQRWESGEIANIRRDKIASLSKALHTSPAYLMGWSDDADSEMKNIITLDKAKKIPLLGKIACGDPILAQENWDEVIILPNGVKADFALRCQGDSMIDARINDGDIAFILMQPTVENGEIAAVLIDDEATLKRFYQQEDKVILQPENKSYTPLVYVGEEINNIKIVGKATHFLSEVI